MELLFPVSLEGFNTNARQHEILCSIETRKLPLFANIGTICFFLTWKCPSIVILRFMETCSNKGKQVKILDKSATDLVLTSDGTRH